MRLVVPLIAFIALVCTACGSEIGDSCTLSSDCSPDGDRTCDSSSPGGYCTVLGCDYGTCPDEAVCVRFFSVGATNIPCASAADCSADELCTLGGYCVPKNAEVRYCMKKCGGDGDCRDEYECRDRELMIMHGGEPVPPPGESVPDDPQRFCGAQPLQ